LNIESKQIWCSLDLGGKARKSIDSNLGAATRDCKAIKDPNWKVKLGIGLLFVLPYKQDIKGIQVSSLQENLNLFVKKLTRLAEDLDASFITVHFANMETSRRIYNADRRHGWCPGIVAIGKLID